MPLLPTDLPLFIVIMADGLPGTFVLVSLNMYLYALGAQNTGITCTFNDSL